MTVAKWVKLSWLLMLTGVIGSCASTSNDGVAMVETRNAATTAAITNTLRQAMGRQNITLGVREGDFDSIVTVLPPPLGPNETRSLSVPEIFDIKKRNNNCYLVNRATGVSYALNNVTCVVPPPLLVSTGR